MEFLYLLERMRLPVLNEFMLLITQFGEETAFLVAAMIIFWCVDKYKGYYILSVGFIGTLANQFMKLWFRIPRPWILDKNFTILEQAREAASGYSFPSGHTQSAVGTFGAIAYTTNKRWIRYCAIAVAILVPFSRMYIGVHTPLDVCVAAVMAVALVFALRPFFSEKNRKYVPFLLGIMLVLAVAYFCFITFYRFPADIDPHNLESGTKNAYTLLGALLGLLTVYIVDEKWIHFPTKAVWWVQVIKVAVGFVLVLLVKSGLKDVLTALFGLYPGRAVRYYLIVIVAGILWPLSFKFFSKLGVKE